MGAEFQTYRLGQDDKIETVARFYPVSHFDFNHRFIKFVAIRFIVICLLVIIRYRFVKPDCIVCKEKFEE